jgi:DNA-binding PadR family transcriptional regulator
MVYPALTYLEEMGYANSEAEGSKKLYRITEAGSEYLAKNRASAEEMLDHLARYGRKMAQFRDQFVEEDEESRESHSHGGRTSEWEQTRAEFRELRHELKSMLREKIGSSPEERKRIIAILRKAVEEIRNK